MLKRWLLKSAALFVAAILCAPNSPLAFAQKPSAAKSLGIHSVDFKNFIYRPSCWKKPIQVKGGIYELTNPANRLLFQVAEVSYGDLNGDGQEEAIVLTGCNTGGSGVFSEGFVFGMINGRVHQLTNVAGGDRAWGSIQSVTVTDKLLSVTRLAPDGPDGPACCPKYLETTKYKLAAGKLLQEGKTTRSDYEQIDENAKEAMTKSVTGTVTYRQRIALAPGSQLEVSILDVSLADGAAKVIAKQEISTTTQVPIAFEIKYDPSLIDSSHSYVVRALITTEGKLSWTTDTAYPVLTRGQSDHADLLLVQVP